MKVAIVILHYKNIDDTLRCLESVKKLDKKGLEIETIVVDNSLQKLHLGGVMASPSTSSGSACHPARLRRASEVVIPLFIIRNKKNLGFAAGVNVGIKKALKDKGTDYVLILNNDTILPRNLLKVLLKERVDIVSPVIKFKWNNSWVYDYGGKVNWWTGRTGHIESGIRNQELGIDRLSFRAKSRNLVQKTSYEEDPSTLPTESGLVGMTKEQIDYVSGCCMLVRREVFEKIGLFDEDYFFYFEDADFCTRAKREGFRVKVNPNIAVFHKLGGSIGRWTKEAIVRNLWGNFLFIKKNLGWRKPVGFVYLLLLTCKILVNYLLNRSFK